MRPAIETLNAVSFYDRSVQESATGMLELAVFDAIKYISENEKIPSKTREKSIQKLKSIKLNVMFPDEILNLTKIEEFYTDLDFKGNESLFELAMKILVLDWKLQMQPDGHWITNLHTVIRKDIPIYFVEQNLFCKNNDF